MAKKKDNKNKEEIKEFEVTNCDLQKDAPVEVVAKCNHPEEVIANCDHLQSLKFRPTLPFAFTEQGIGQLSSVVHSQIAIERSIIRNRVRMGCMGLCF